MFMKKIIILTGSELRHVFFRKFIALSDDIKIINSYCEKPEKDSQTTVSTQNNYVLRTKHFINREQSEKDFFELFIDNVSDNSRPIFLLKGDINSSSYIEAIIKAKPDLLVAYGCSIIKEPLVSAFKGRVLNIHLGLSPYYRGSGTNYWPLVNGEPEYVGATFMHLDSGIDTGEIIHQTRPRIIWGDTPAQIGNRLIADMAFACREIIRHFDVLKECHPRPNQPKSWSTKKRIFQKRR